VVAADVADDRFVHLVAADADRAGIDDAAEGQHADLVVPPPMSTTMEPVGSVTGRPAPIAAAIGSSISQTLRAPALSAASRSPGARPPSSRRARR